jgi:hypothetical protein
MKHHKEIPPVMSFEEACQKILDTEAPKVYNDEDFNFVNEEKIIQHRTAPLKPMTFLEDDYDNDYEEYDEEVM